MKYNCVLVCAAVAICLLLLTKCSKWDQSLKDIEIITVNISCKAAILPLSQCGPMVSGMVVGFHGKESRKEVRKCFTTKGMCLQVLGQC